MSWDWTRIVRGLALATWGAFFVYLWASGRATTYIGPKTAWVVTLGAVTLPLVAVAYLWGARGARRPASRRELGVNALLVAPILLALMVPTPSLGSLAAKNKRTAHAPAPIAAPRDGLIRLYEIAWAAQSEQWAQTSRMTTGMPVDFVGFVSGKLAARDVELSRFFVTCCAADATVYSVRVTLPAGTPQYPNDTWVSVKGRLAGRPGHDLRVAADAVREVSAPANPYT